VVKGEIKKEDELELTRGERILGTVKIASLRKGKTDVNIVRQGEECGILMYPQLDFKEGDMLLSFAIKK
jgi:translation initiation factor IF-2